MMPMADTNIVYQVPKITFTHPILSEQMSAARLEPPPECLYGNRLTSPLPTSILPGTYHTKASLGKGITWNK